MSPSSHFATRFHVVGRGLIVDSAVVECVEHGLQAFATERAVDLFRAGRELSEPRADLDEGAATLLFLSAANWAYTWLQLGRDTDALADRLHA